MSLVVPRFNEDDALAVMGPPCWAFSVIPGFEIRFPLCRQPLRRRRKPISPSGPNHSRRKVEGSGTGCPTFRHSPIR